MKKSKKRVFLIVWLLVIALIVVGLILVGGPLENNESIKEVMRDGVLHEMNRVNLFGREVNPGVISAFTVTAVLLLFALIIRIFVIPHFKYIPGKFQSAIEKAVEFFSGMAEKNSPHGTGFIGAYIFSAGIYIFFGTLFELAGAQAITIRGNPIALPAPLSDINAAIAMGFLSYAVILAAGVIRGGLRGAFGVLKDFSLPVSMSFRLFGALLSGLLMTELVYYYVSLSIVLPVIVGVLFTLLHALIQTYVLATLVSVFYGEAIAPKKKKAKLKKEK